MYKYIVIYTYIYLYLYGMGLYYIRIQTYIEIHIIVGSVVVLYVINTPVVELLFHIYMPVKSYVYVMCVSRQDHL